MLIIYFIIFFNEYWFQTVMIQHKIWNIMPLSFMKNFVSADCKNTCDCWNFTKKDDVTIKPIKRCFFLLGVWNCKEIFFIISSSTDKIPFNDILHFCVNVLSFTSWFSLNCQRYEICHVFIIIHSYQTLLGFYCYYFLLSVLFWNK